MTYHTPAEDVVSFLNGKIINARTLTSGTNLFACEPRVGTQYPSKSVFVWEATGAPPMPYMGTPALRGSVFYPRVQLRVRGEPDAMQETRSACRDVSRLLHRAALSGYASALINESTPIHLGEGAHGGYEFGLNLDLICSDRDQPYATVYSGASAVDIDTEAEVLALTAATGRYSPATTLTITAGVGAFIYYVIPVSYGTPTFTVGMFSGGFNLHATTTVGGVAYNVFRSDNSGLGACTIVVT